MTSRERRFFHLALGENFHSHPVFVRSTAARRLVAAANLCLAVRLM
jgi:hypothetical protein